MFASRLLFTAIVLGLSAASTPAQLLVPESHNRIRIGNTQAFAASKCTGRVLSSWPNGDNTWGSGVLISRNHVLTCAHNIYYEPNGGWAKVIGFAPAIDGPIYPFGATASNLQRVHQQWIANSTPGSNYDIGVLRLHSPLGDKAGWMTLTEWDDAPDGPVSLNGYDGDVLFGEHQLTRTALVRDVIDWPLHPNSRFRGDWYAYEGSSGGPVWYTDPHGKLRVIGVSTSRGVTGSFGTRVTDDFAALIRDFMRRYP